MIQYTIPLEAEDLGKMSSSMKSSTLQGNKFIDATPNSHFFTAENVYLCGVHQCYYYKFPNAEVRRADMYPGRRYYAYPNGIINPMLTLIFWLESNFIYACHYVNLAIVLLIVLL